jgi:hypothetical protein
VVAAPDEERTTRRFDLDLALVGEERPADVALTSMQPFRTNRLEVGSGLTDELVNTTEAMTAHQALCARGERVGVNVDVLSRFSNDIGPDTAAQVEAMAPEWVVIGAGDPAHDALVASSRRRLVVLEAEHVLDAPVSGVLVAWNGEPDGDHAVLLGLLLAVSRGLPLAVEPVSGASARRARALVSALRARRYNVVDDTSLATPVCRVGTLDGGPADIRVRAQEQAMRIDWANVVLPVSAPDPADA